MRGFDTRVCSTQTRSVDCFEVNVEALDVKQRELLAQHVMINSSSDHRAEDHVAACTGKTVEVQSLHNRGNTSPAFPVTTSSHRSDRSVLSGLISQTNAPADFAISGRPAAGYTS